MDTPASISLSERIRQMALAIGVDAVGFAPAVRLDADAAHLQEWLNAGYQADMEWMKGHFEKRVDPALLVEGTKSVVVVLLSYKPLAVQNPRVPQISKYAYGKDYHIVLKDKLWELLRRIREVVPGVEGRAFVDTAPVLEKAWAVRAGLGWIGKNSLLLNRQLGSFSFIGALMLNIELDYGSPVKTTCGSCRRCIDTCPTQAIVAPMVVDSNRCISYQTIENRGEIPLSLQDKMGKRLFGCDSCQDVCPWNVRALPSNHSEFTINEAILHFTQAEWENIQPDDFSRIFRHSPVKRAKFSGFQRNLRIALKNM